MLPMLSRAASGEEFYPLFSNSLVIARQQRQHSPRLRPTQADTRAQARRPAASVTGEHSNLYSKAVYNARFPQSLTITTFMGIKGRGLANSARARSRDNPTPERAPAGCRTASIFAD